MFQRTFVVLATLSMGLAAPPAFSAPPGQKPDGLGEFVPHAGYAHTLKAMRIKRLAGIPLAPGETRSLRGTRSIPVICVEFNNVKFNKDGAPYTTCDYEKLLFATDDGALSMSTYYKDISNGLFQVTGKVLGPYKLPDKDTDYEGSNNGKGGAHFGRLLKEAFTKADADIAIDFGQYDNDGPDGKPNSGDDDGKVDTIFIIHPEIGGECKRAGETDNIWSHSWHYSKCGHDGPFVTNDVSHRIDPGTKKPIPGAKILIEDYTVQPGLSCKSTDQTKKIVEIGVFCHEYGHALNLPDLYDRTEPQAECVGNWCLMASGSYGGDDDHADRPCHMSAWCKHYLGWADVKPLSNALTHVFEPVDQRNRIYRFTVAGTKNLEYFLIEYRRKSRWDEFLRTGGLAIWHIDERIGGASDNWPFAPENEGQNDSPNALSTSPPPIFIGPDHQLVALIQADGHMTLEKTALGNRGDETDLFKSGDFADDATGKKGSRSYDGQPTGLEVLGIELVENEIKARIKVGSGPLAAPPASPPRPILPLVQTQLDTVDFLKEIQLTIKDKGLIGLDDASKIKLRNVPEFLLHHAAENDPALAQAAAKSRTKVVDKTTAGDMPMASMLKNIVNDDDDNHVLVQFDYSGDAIERITQLSAGLEGRTFKADALRRSNQWKDLVGQNVTLEPVVTEPESKVQRFSQLLQVKGKSLPVFGNQHAYYYSQDKLIGVSCNPLQSDLKIVGQPGDLTERAAKELVAETLGIPKSKSNSLAASEGLYISDEWPFQAQVAIRVLVPAGDQQQDLEAYVDSATGKIVAVK